MMRHRKKLTRLWIIKSSRKRKQKTKMDIEKENNEVYLNVLALKCEKKWQQRFIVSTAVNLFLLCICAVQSFL